MHDLLPSQMLAWQNGTNPTITFAVAEKGNDFKIGLDPAILQQIQGRHGSLADLMNVVHGLSHSSARSVSNGVDDAQIHFRPLAEMFYI